MNGHRPGGRHAKSDRTPEQAAHEQTDELEVVDGEIVDILQSLDKDGAQPVQREELARVLRTMTVHQHHRGPLPSLHYMQGMKDIVPDGPERIIAMAETEQSHRHAMEVRDQALTEKSEDDDYRVTRRGQLFGFLICVFVIGVAAILALMDHENIAAVLVGLDLVSLAAVFVAGRWLPVRSTQTDASGEVDPAHEDTAELEQ